MLKSFSIKNYRSICKTSVDLTFGESRAPSGYTDWDEWAFYEPAKGTRLVPCLALYGANASGKTNIIRAFSVLQHAVVLGGSIYVPNRILSSGDRTSFVVIFCRGKDIFEYCLEFNDVEILKEKLIYNRKIVFCLESGQNNFSGLAIGPTYSEDRLQEILRVECCLSGKQIKTMLSRLGWQYHGLNEAASYIFDEICSIEIYRQNEFPILYGMDKLARASAEEIDQAFQQISKLLSKLDVGITQLSYDKSIFSPGTDDSSLFTRKTDDMHIFDKKIEDKEKLFVASIRSHRKDANGKEVIFDFQHDESDGTRVLTGLLGVCLSALVEGRTVIIDELDRSLHPLLLIEIVRLFKSKRYNTKGAQLVFSVHATDLLDADMLRVSEIGIVDKTFKKGTELHRIVDFEGVKNIFEFRQKYLNGNFGGLPAAYI